MRKFLSILMVLALMTALFVSCSQDKVGSVVGEDLVSVSFATGGSSRTLTVSREAFDENDYIWCYTAVKADNSGLTTGETKVGGILKEAYVWGDDHTRTGLTGATITDISQGLWDFTLRAYVPEYDSEGHITGKTTVMAWFGSVTNQPVRKNEANVVNVTVSAVSTGTGTITFEDVVVRPLSGSDITASDIVSGTNDLKLGVGATTFAGTEVDFVEYKSGGELTPGKFDVDAGSYFVTFKAYEGTFADPTFVYAEETIAVNVYSALKTIISGYVSELSSYVQFGEPVANAIIEAQTPSVIDVTPTSAPISFVTDSTQSTSYKAASIPAVAVVNIKQAVEASIPTGSTLTDLALSLNVEDKGSTDASEKTTKKFEISLDAVVTTTDESTGSVTVESSSVTGGIEDFMTVQLYIGKELADLKVYHHDVEIMKSGSQLLGAEYYEYDDTAAGDGILTLHVNSFSPFSVEYSKKVAVARLIKADGTGSDFYTLEEAVDAAVAGDTVKFLKDITLPATATAETDRFTISEDITIDFGMNKLIAPGSLEPTRNFAALWITGNVVFEGTTGGIDCLDKQNGCGPYAVNIKEGGTLTVEGGVYHGGGTAIQVQKGALYINGGSFSVTAFDAPYGYDFLINCVDAAYQAGEARVEIKGGTFDHFNPADNASEGAHTNYVPAGYDVVVEGNLYTVVPYVGEGVVVNMTSVPRIYYTLVDGKLADLNGVPIPEQNLPAKTDELVLLDSSLADDIDVSIDNFNAGYTWTAIHSETEPDYGKQYFEGGWGTRIEPYLIGSHSQLVNMDIPSVIGSGKDFYYALITDINAKDYDTSSWAHGYYYNDTTYYHVNMRAHKLTIGNKHLFGYAVKLEMCNGTIEYDSINSGYASVVGYACASPDVNEYEMYFHDLVLTGSIKENTASHYGPLVSYAFSNNGSYYKPGDTVIFRAETITSNMVIDSKNSNGYVGGLLGYVEGPSVSASVVGCIFNGSIVAPHVGSFINTCSAPKAGVESSENILNGSLLGTEDARAFGCNGNITGGAAALTKLNDSVNRGPAAVITILPPSTTLITVAENNEVILNKFDTAETYRVAVVFNVDSPATSSGGFPRFITVDIPAFDEDSKNTGIYRYAIIQESSDTSEGKQIVVDQNDTKIWIDAGAYHLYSEGYVKSNNKATIKAIGYKNGVIVTYQDIPYQY